MLKILRNLNRVAGKMKMRLIRKSDFSSIRKTFKVFEQNYPRAVGARFVQNFFSSFQSQRRSSLNRFISLRLDVIRTVCKYFVRERFVS